MENDVLTFYKSLFCKSLGPERASKVLKRVSLVLVKELSASISVYGCIQKIFLRVLSSRPCHHWTALFKAPLFPGAFCRPQCSKVDPLYEDEAQHFVHRCKPELHDFPRLAEALGAHLAPSFGRVKAEEVRRATEVSPIDRSWHAEVVVNVRLSATYKPVLFFQGLMSGSWWSLCSSRASSACRPSLPGGFCCGFSRTIFFFLFFSRMPRPASACVARVRVPHPLPLKRGNSEEPTGHPSTSFLTTSAGCPRTIGRPAHRRRALAGAPWIEP